MSKKRYSSEEIVNKLREADILLGQGQTSQGYQAGSWTKSRRVVAKIEWHREELFPRVGFIVTNLSWSA